MSRGPRQVRADIAAAKPVTIAAAPPPPPPPPPKHLRERFHLKPDGVWMDQPDDKPQLWLCSRLEAIAETQDDDQYFGVQWEWTDRYGCTRREVFAREQFSGEAGTVCSAMAARGLTFNQNRAAKQGLIEYLAISSSSVRARVVSRPGWHDIGGALVYVLPGGETVGKASMPAVLQTTGRETNLFQQSGTLAEWRVAIAERAIGNSRLILSVCVSFAAPLLFLLGEDGGGINLYADSRSGKTTCAVISASVYGGDPARGGARAAMRTWRGTSNSTEAVAALHSDIGLTLDELGQADARDIGATAYMLVAGRGKDRLDRGIGLRAALTWRLLFLSTGELTLEAKMAEAGIKMRAGQGVRLVDLPADEGAGLGAFRELHGADNAGDFAQELREASSRCYGTAFRVFIECILRRLDTEPDFRERLRDDLNRITAAWLAPFGDHSGQVRSVARRFAMIALAGNLASDAMITGWGNTESGMREAEWAAHRCFTAWLAERGTTCSHEGAQAVIELRKFISQHGGARFEDWKDRHEEAAQVDTEASPPAERFRTMNRAGWRKWVLSGGKWEWRYFVTTEGMREALSGLGYKQSLRILASRGLILAGSKEIAKPMSPPGFPKTRLYEVPASIMVAEPDPLPALED